MSAYEEYFKQYREKTMQMQEMEEEMDRVQIEAKRLVRELREKQQEVRLELIRMRKVITKSIDEGIDPIHAALVIDHEENNDNVWEQRSIDHIDQPSHITGVQVSAAGGLGSVHTMNSGVGNYHIAGAIGAGTTIPKINPASMHPGYGAVPPSHSNFGSLHTTDSSTII